MNIYKELLKELDEWKKYNTGGWYEHGMQIETSKGIKWIAFGWEFKGNGESQITVVPTEHFGERGWEKRFNGPSLKYCIEQRWTHKEWMEWIKSMISTTTGIADEYKRTFEGNWR